MGNILQFSRCHTFMYLRNRRTCPKVQNHPLVGFLSPDNGGQSVIGALLATAEPLGSLRSADRREAIKGGVKTIEYFMYVRKSKFGTHNRTPFYLSMPSA